MLLLTGRDVWEGIVKLGWLSGSYDPKTNRQCANADALAALLNQVLGKRQNWLPDLVETEDAMREWEASTCCGSTSSSICTATRSWVSTPQLSVR
jgi:hypothetical protein